MSGLAENVAAVRYLYAHQAARACGNSALKKDAPAGGVPSFAGGKVRAQ